MLAIDIHLHTEQDLGENPMFAVGINGFSTWSHRDATLAVNGYCNYSVTVP